MKTQEENKELRKPQKYGYIRISDSTQKINRQLDFMKELGISEENLFVDRQSGKDFQRPAYKRLFRQLRENDVLYIKELDRLGRNKVEIKEELNKLRKKKIHVRIANIPTTMHDFGEDDWILDMVNNILIEVLAAVAEQERITNHQRQAEGIAAARMRGVHLGRPYVTIPDNFPELYEQWMQKKMTKSEILEILNVDAVKFRTYVRSYRTQTAKKKSN